MSKTSGSSGGITRRGFLKATGVSAGALGLAGVASMTSADGWLAPAKAIAEPEERKAIICHQFHCLSSCGLECTVRDGRMVLVEPMELEDGTRGQVCLRGITEVQHTYTADRLQTPLKRVGERGEGKFVQISWDEAIKTVADAIKDCRAKYGEDSFFYRKSTEASVAHNYEFLASLLKADTGGRWGLDRGQANGSDPSGLTSGGLCLNSIYDWKNAATVVHLGSNLMESAMTWTPAFFEAKKNGTHMITVDFRYSPTAQKSHEWLAVTPGTDTALILGSINHILANKWYDEEFMKAHTSMPYLINKATGEIMGKMAVKIDPEVNEPVVDPETGETLEVKVPMVWDAATNAARYLDEAGIVPALEGTYNVDGIDVVTQFDLLKEQMAEFTPQWAAEVTGLTADQITSFADRYANAGPAIISYGFGGPDKYANADILGHSTSVLAAITGNSGKPGTGIGFYGIGGAKAGAEAIKFWEMPEEFVPGDSPVAMYDMPYEDNNIHCALTFGDAFTLESGSANNMLDWVKTLDFFAICDIYHSSAVDYADIVLPACSKFESAEDVSDVRTGAIAPYVYLNQKVIDPLFEAKEDIEIERLIAAEFGLDKYMPQSNEELAKFMLSEPEGNMAGMTYEALKENGAMKLLDSDDIITGADAVPDQQYSTDTGRIELYYEDLLEHDLAFPQYETPQECYRENPKANDYPLMFVQGKSRYRIHAYYSASTWFQEYFGPVVNIHPKDAEARGIAMDDDVRIWNDRGEFVCRALINESVMPGTLFMAETTYNHYYPEGFLQNVTNAYRQERCYPMIFGPQIPYNDTLVEMKKA